MDNRFVFKYCGLFIYCLITMVSIIIAIHNCMPDFYYDGVTRSCAPCSDICVNAKIQRTEPDCRRLCPDSVAISTTLKTATIPATTVLPHNATSPQSRDEIIQNTDLITSLTLSFVTISVIIYLIIRSVCFFMNRCRQHTHQHEQNEQGTSRWKKCLYRRKKQSDGSLSEVVSLASMETNEANEQASQQPQEHDVPTKLLVTGADTTKSLEQGGKEAQTQRKEFDTTRDQD